MDAQAVGLMVVVVSGVAAFGLYIIRAEMRGDVTRLDGRINSHEASCLERQKKLDERYAEANRRLDSIDGKLDRLLDGQH